MDESSLCRLQDDNDFFEEQFSGLAIQKVHFSRKQFENCAFKKCKFTHGLFSQCTFLDCTFHDCDLSSLNIAQSSFREVHFLSSKLIGIDWTLANIHLGFDIFFEDCVLDYGNLNGMNLSGVRADSCRLHEAKLDDTQLKGARFTGVDAQGTSMRRADLRQANLKGVHNLALDLSSCRLGGTQISIDSAYDSLALLGVKVAG